MISRRSNLKHSESMAALSRPGPGRPRRHVARHAGPGGGRRAHRAKGRARRSAGPVVEYRRLQENLNFGKLKRHGRKVPGVEMLSLPLAVPPPPLSDCQTRTRSPAAGRGGSPGLGH